MSVLQNNRCLSCTFGNVFPCPLPECVHAEAICEYLIERGMVISVREHSDIKRKYEYLADLIVRWYQDIDMEDRTEEEMCNLARSLISMRSRT